MNIKKESVAIDLDTIEKLRNIVYWTPGLTMGQLVEVALDEYIANHNILVRQRERELHKGKKPKGVE